MEKSIADLKDGPWLGEAFKNWIWIGAVGLEDQDETFLAYLGVARCNRTQHLIGQLWRCKHDPTNSAALHRKWNEPAFVDTQPA